MFGWFRKNVRKIGIFGVEVEFQPPTDPAVLAASPKPADPPAASATPKAEAALRLVSPPVVTRPTGSVAVDKAAVLAQVEECEGAAARADYERVLDDLIAWSEGQGGLLTFSPNPAKNTQAILKYRFRGSVFWDMWPQKRTPAKFTYEYDFDRERLVAEFAKLSPNGRPVSPILPSVSFRDLVPVAARDRLKQLLGEALENLTRPPSGKIRV